MNSQISVSVKNLRKEYESVIALASITLEIERGQTFGLIGPNGAGKSTFIKMLAALEPPDFGVGTVEGADLTLDPLRVRRLVGFMPDFFSLYDSTTAEDFLTYFGLAFGLGRFETESRVNWALGAVQLVEKRTAQIAHLSRGMKQRLVLAKTLIHDPPLLLLDEPFSGLDPNARKEMSGVIGELASLGKTVLISSHILSELGDFCDSIAILEKGHLRAAGKISDIEARFRSGLMATVELTGKAGEAARLLAGFEGVSAVEAFDRRVRFSFEGERAALAELNKRLVLAGFGVVTLTEEKSGLEDLYFQISAHETQ